MSEIGSGSAIDDGAYDYPLGALDPRQVELGLHAANFLHNYIMQDYVPTLMRAFPVESGKVDLYFAEDEDTIKFKKGFGPNLRDASDERTEYRFMALILGHTEDAWSLRLQTARYRHDGTLNRVGIFYSIDVAESAVSRAQLSARVLTSGEETLDSQANIIEPEIWRNIYERHLNSRDCFRLQQRLRQTANHCLALAS